MRLVIISSSPDGKIGLVSERVFADAADATRELGRLFAEGTVDTSGAFYTVDMDTAVPVIVLQQPSAPVPVPDVVPDEMPEEDVVPDEAAIEEPEQAEVPEAEEEPEQAEEPEADVPEAEPVEAEAEAEAETAPQEAEAGAQWPWDLPVIVPEGSVDPSGEQAAADETEAEPGQEAAGEPPVPPAIEADATADDGPYIVAPFDDEEASVPSPVPFEEPDATEALEIVSEEPADLPVDVPVLSEEEEAPGEAAEEPAEAPAPEDVEAPAEDADTAGEDFVLDIPAFDEGVEPAVPVEAEDAASPMAVAEPQSVLEMSATASEAGQDDAASEKVYEPGALNMSEYTCDDCVYVNTCPNQHQKKPAECGSFQWRSV